ncbi:hypothetical protein [Sphingomonas sp. Leaf25]|uniref:hypothetical protein n=1 Tax=Sphingomonas sp. Leaf25 TaxID=1735692 RepID=UPI0012E26755|nr:hypothetical protein [Sphingomonas sp. Leaf25]
MRDLLDLLARGAIHIGFVIFNLILVAVVAFGSLIAIKGTGGFTSDPPPDQPAWLGLVFLVVTGGATGWGLLRLRRWLIATLDRVASRQ